MNRFGQKDKKNHRLHTGPHMNRKRLIKLMLRHENRITQAGGVLNFLVSILNIYYSQNLSDDMFILLRIPNMLSPGFIEEATEPKSCSFKLYSDMMKLDLLALKSSRQHTSSLARLSIVAEMYLFAVPPTSLPLTASLPHAAPQSAAQWALRSPAAGPSFRAAAPLAGLVIASVCRRGVVCHQKSPATVVLDEPEKDLKPAKKAKKSTKKVKAEKSTKKVKAAKSNKVSGKEEKPKKGAASPEFNDFMKKFMKKHGEGAIMDFSQKEMRVPHFSTGAFSLDLALGGGLPYGRMIEVYGPEQSGKTTMALSCCISLQKSGRRKCCAFIDVEHALNMEYALQMGLDLDKTKFVATSPKCAEDALDMAISFAESKLFDLIIIDSVAALVPLQEDEGGMADSSMALRARLLSKFCRKVTHICAETETSLLCINQLRANIGDYGQSEDTVGGKGIKYTASVRMEVRSPLGGKIGGQDNPTGIRSKVHVVKNKLAAPYRRAEYDLIFGKGICWSSSVVEAGIKYKLVEQKGAWFEYEGHREQGKESMVRHFEKEAEVREKLEKDIRALSEKDEDEVEEPEEEV